MPVGAASNVRGHLPVRYVITPDVAQKAGLITKNKVGDHLSEDGIVSLAKGHLHMDATNLLGVVTVHGKIHVDPQWGGDVETRSFSATVDTNKGTMSQFRSW